MLNLYISYLFICVKIIYDIFLEKGLLKLLNYNIFFDFFFEILMYLLLMFKL